VGLTVERRIGLIPVQKCNYTPLQNNAKANRPKHAPANSSKVLLRSAHLSNGGRVISIAA
jgi:hypothetical protein